MKKIEVYLYLVFSLTFIELMLALFTIKRFNLFFIAFFSLVYASFLCLTYKKKILFYFISLMTIILYLSNFIYYKVYASFLTFNTAKDGTQVFEFFDQILVVFKSNLIFFILLLIPIVVYILLLKFDLLENKFNLKYSLVFLLVLVVSSLLSGNYFKDISSTTIVRNYGLLHYYLIDIRNQVFPIKIDLVNDDEDIDVEKEYNVLPIDFDKLIENETDSDLIMMYNYFKNKLPSEKNEYTGILKDKNLIVIIGESFTEYAISDVTPNLQHFYENSLVFSNFYTPLFPSSTADGEYISKMSLLPKSGLFSIKAVNKNYIPFSYANVFRNMGYKTNAYHNHSGKYYDRHLFIKALGYESYKACRYPNLLAINCNRWPASDLEMMQASVKDYINEERFMTYYITVSGHLNYTTLGNSIVRQNYHLVKDLDLSPKAKGYLASQIELDRAIGYLIEELTKANKLEDTVIVLSSDHYPYGLTLDEINELSSYEKDKYFEMHKNMFMIYNPIVKKEVKTLSSSIDILPTVLNLFGVDYDSRLLIGTDILSSNDPLVIFANRSYITDASRYNSLKSDIIDDRIKIRIENDLNISKLILEKDFYSKIKGEL
jgi:lipoteichoic acid synthase